MTEPFEAKAVIFSLCANIGPNHPENTNTDTVTIIKHKDNNRVIVEYKGKRYGAVFNPFVCMYYVDDRNGPLPEE